MTAPRPERWTTILEARAAKARSRAAIRRWEYRQRHHSKGTWFRFRRALAYSRAAFEIPEAEAARLLEEGFTAEPVGEELVPPKVIIFVPQERAERLAGATPLPVNLRPPMLAARHVVLVPFNDRPKER